MAYNKKLYKSSTSAFDAENLYDSSLGKLQNEINEMLLSGQAVECSLVDGDNTDYQLTSFQPLDFVLREDIPMLFFINGVYTAEDVPVFSGTPLPTIDIDGNVYNIAANQMALAADANQKAIIYKPAGTTNIYVRICAFNSAAFSELIGDISNEYDETSTYAVGDLCIYDNALYSCNTDIVTPEAWNSAHWTQTSLITELDGKVSKSGDTMTGALIYDSSAGAYPIRIYNDCGMDDLPSVSHSRYILFYDSTVDNDTGNVSHTSTAAIRNFITKVTKDQVDHARLGMQLSTTYGGESNAVILYIDDDGNKTVYVTDEAAWRKAIHAVNSAGDTLTGGLVIPALSSVSIGDGYGIKESTYGIPAGDGKPAVLPTSSNATRLMACMFDKYNTAVAYLRGQVLTRGASAVNIAARYLQDGNSSAATSNYITLTCKKDTQVVDGVSTLVDESTVALSHPLEWRKALGIGNATTGGLPILVNQGGTGGTTTTAALASLGAYDFKTNGTNLSSGTNVDTGLTNGKTYYIGSATAAASLNGTLPTTLSGFKIIQDVPYGGSGNNYKYQFATTSTGLMYRMTNGSGVWGDWGHFITDGPRPGGDSTTSNIISLASSDFTISSGAIYTWGKVVSFNINIKKTTAVTSASVIQVGTIVAGKRPIVQSGIHASTSKIAFGSVQSSGVLSVYGTWTAGETIGIRTIYLIP